MKPIARGTEPGVAIRVDAKDAHNGQNGHQDSGSHPFMQIVDESSMVTRNPAPDASPPSASTKSRTYKMTG